VNLRKIGRINLPNLEPNAVSGAVPECVMVDPSALYVEEQYQRNLADKSIKLIRRMVRTWNWAHMKPPICVRSGDKLFVVDGQHTAIAAASHPDIMEIPIMIVEAAEVKDRARAFVAHNRVRLGVTSTQIFFSELAAGDEIAVAVDQACTRAKVKILKTPPGHGIFNPGETMSAIQLKTIAAKKGVNALVRVLKILVECGRAPLKNTELSAVFAILYGSRKMPVDDYDLVSVIRSKSIQQWENHVARRREEQRISLTQALADAWINALPKAKAA
jgi:hypothetical protein